MTKHKTTRRCTAPGCKRPVSARDLCSTHYSIAWRRKKFAPQPYTPRGTGLQWIREIVANPPSGCAEWPFFKDQNGYGQVTFRNNRTRAHRVALILATGRDHPLLEAAHAPVTCSNPSCCNPSHLRWATHSENMADTITDGTSRRGTRHHGSKLTEEQVLEILDLVHVGVLQEDIADDYGIVSQTVSDIKRGRRWSWLTGAQRSHSQAGCPPPQE